MKFDLTRPLRSAATLVLIGILAGCNASAPTKQSVEDAVAAEVPAKASRVWVQNWIAKQGWQSTFNPHDKGRSGRPTLSVKVPKTSQSFLVTGDTFVEFVFDKNEKLQSHTATEMLTGP